MTSRVSRWASLALLAFGAGAWAGSPRLVVPQPVVTHAARRTTTLTAAPLRTARSRLDVTLARTATLGGPGSLRAGAQGGRGDGLQGINGSTLRRRVPR